MITQAELKELFTYDPITGGLYHKIPNRARKIGDRAGNVTPDGYRTIKIKGVSKQASWLVWLYHTGRFPSHELDHLNLRRSDDRFENLREATRSQNCMNRKKKVGKWGYRGVKKSHNRFSASLVKDQKLHYFGAFSTPEEAARAYDIGARKLFGEFALLNFPDVPIRDWLHVATIGRLR